MARIIFTNPLKPGRAMMKKPVRPAYNVIDAKSTTILALWIYRSVFHYFERLKEKG